MPNALLSKGREEATTRKRAIRKSTWIFPLDNHIISYNDTLISLSEDKVMNAQRHNCVVQREEPVPCYFPWTHRDLPTWRLVSGVFIHLVPGSVLLFPDDDLTVVGAGGQNIAEHWVSPRNLPHGTLMATQTERPKFSWCEGNCQKNMSIMEEQAHLWYQC